MGAHTYRGERVVITKENVGWVVEEPMGIAAIATSVEPHDYFEAFEAAKEEIDSRLATAKKKPAKKSRKTPASKATKKKKQYRHFSF